MTMIDMSKPYIMIERIKKEEFFGVGKLIIDFKLNGCVTVNEVYYVVNDVQELLSINGYCNHLVEEDRVQSTFTVKVDWQDTV